jgi:lipopolysaccharide export system protein LptA
MSIVNCQLSTAQELVYLEHSETLSFDKKRLPDAQILKGDVRFRHDDMLMFCDSAYFYEKTNSLDAFGHVRFEQGDTLSGFGDVLYYDGNTKYARLRRNVRLIHRNTVLTTDRVDYDRKAERAFYDEWGQIEDSLNTLTSVWGLYMPPQSQAVFRDQVHLVNANFILDTDSLRYNTKTHVADLVRPTTIVYEEETTILSDLGTYNTETEQSRLLNRSRVLHADGKQLTGDTIYYDKRVGYGRVRGHMELCDTVQQTTLYGNYGEVFNDGDSGYATDSALMVDWSNDTAYTYMHADTLFSELQAYVDITVLPIDSAAGRLMPDTLKKDSTYRQLRAFRNVRIYNKDYQAVADSAVYNGLDSVITLYQDPVLWSDKQQVSADVIHIYIRNELADYAHGVGNAIAIKHEARDMFDQMQGKEMFAYIRDGEIRQVDVSGNAETIFYPREDDGTFTGVNKTQSSLVKLYLKDQKIERIVFTTTTNGTMYPLDQIKDSERFLNAFFWAKKERPRDPKDVFRRAERTPRPKEKAASAVAEEELKAEESPRKQKQQRNKKKIEN